MSFIQFFERVSLFLLACLLCSFSIAQQNVIVQQISSTNPPGVALAPLRFLASDELMGRGTMRSEINIAARYISEEFRAIGVKECKGAGDYFQPFSIKMVKYGKSGTLTVNDKTYKMGDDIIQVGGENIDLSAPVVYAGFGNKEELEKLDVKGKIVVTKMGNSDSSSLRESFEMMSAKRKLIQQKGGLALIEKFRPAGLAWETIKQFFVSERPQTGKNDFASFLVNEDLPAAIQSQPANASLNVNDDEVKTVIAKNVLGWVEGTDPKLKNQFIVLSAHYDHLGVAKTAKMEEGKMDSIYNGARDNAIGTTAVIDAARYFANHPARRSILFIAYTAEEIGEIGSRYFSENPVVPLSQLVYNLNIDNASYNDTSIITVIGLGRTSADADIKKACAAYHLTAMPDPAPEQDLFDRSDNANLADKGIPAPTFSLGIKKFDAEINKRYHKLSDEVGNFDLNYGLKYIYSFILAAKYIADNPVQPIWEKGDKYEPAWKELYKH
ncbi:MAG: M28 family peptidase [Bacteroidetes bacterium]|nr:M28 family peptidase [Bacteroidota bacterium]